MFQELLAGEKNKSGMNITFQANECQGINDQGNLTITEKKIINKNILVSSKYKRDQKVIYK